MNKVIIYERLIIISVIKVNLTFNLTYSAGH